MNVEGSPRSGEKGGTAGRSTPGRARRYFDELEPAELALLGHALRLVPENACLTRKGLQTMVPGKPIAMFYEIPEWKSLWDKVAEAIAERDDMEVFRA